MQHKTKGFKRAFIFILVTALLVGSGAVVYWRQVSRRLQQDAHIILEAAGKELAENVTRVLSSQLQVLTAISVSLQDNRHIENTSYLTAYLQEQNKRNSFAFIGFQYPQGKTVFSNGAVQEAFLSREIVEQVYEHSYFISELANNPFKPEKSLLLAVPVRERGQHWGVLFALQPTTAYDDAIDDFSLTDIGLSLIVNQQGQVILAYPNAVMDNVLEVMDTATFDHGYSGTQIRQNMQEGKEGISGYLFRGKHRFASYYPLGYNGWYAMAVLPTSSMAEKIQFLVMMSLVLCLSIIGILGLLLTFILRMQHQNARALYKVGFVDPLTGKDNINAFQLKFPAAAAAFKAKNEPFALVLVNINRFKALNDIYGFEQGDFVLKQVAQALQEGLQEGELFCRSGADVFLLLVACPDRQVLAERIEALAQRAGRFCQMGQECVPLSLTCGIYVLQEETPFYIMLDRANLAWNTAKGQAGRSYAFYDQEYLQKIVTEKRIESHMEVALQERQFKVYLQPKYSFQTGRLVGAEALVRWIHPVRGMIRPDWFIPVFEKNGFVLKLDYYIWQEVVALLHKWQAAGWPMVPVGVNFSRLHLDDPQFIASISSVAQQAAVAPRWLEAELTESVVFGNIDKMKQILDGLHAQGFSVAMDDFGAGYSSLNVLKNMDFDCVKLDKEFLARGEDNPRMRQVISGLVKMIKELGSKVVAEGVETQEQVDFLRSIGCDTAQGFFYSRPLPVEEFEEKLKQDAA